MVLEDLAYFAMDFRKDLSKPGQPPYQASVSKYTENYILFISSSKVFNYAGQRIGTMIISDTLYNTVASDLKRYYASDIFGQAMIFGTLYALTAGTAHSTHYALAAMLKAVNDGKFDFIKVVKEYGEKAKIMKNMFTDNGFQIVYDLDEDEPIADGFYFTFSYPNLPEYGKQIEIGNKQFWILSPSLQDKLQSLKRRAQIILPRDAAQIIMNCSIESGNTVLEAGIGSGSLTIALASAIAPDGHVISYDIRKDFIDHAMKNIQKAGLEKYVTTEIRDVAEEIDQSELDAIILDVPNPWDALDHAWNALKVGGYFCSYSPLISQVENTVKSIQNQSFIEIKTFENIQREMVVSKYGTRPSFDMLGHTGYLTFARKVL